jgi:ketosteroid isomerase-like protein
MAKRITRIIPFFLFFTLSVTAQQNRIQVAAVNKTLDQWHRDVADADFDRYFNALTENSIFIGTDAGEIWTKKQFQDFSKPYFEKKKTWDFKALRRNVYFSKDGNTAWFDEVLDTWMGLCRGSGVLTKENNQWKIAHYVLSVTVPNDDMQAVIKVKKEKDSIAKSLLKLK